MKKALPFIAAQVLSLSPLIALAQATGGQNLGQITSVFESFISFINNTLIPLVFALALLLFFWGIFKFFMLSGGDPGKREEGKQLMLWAVIGFVVMASIYGIVAIISSGLGINNQTQINVPVVPNR